MEIITNNEQTHQHQCWCCWETDNVSSNPMIRACLGCKDPDLQYIHKDCIETYLRNMLKATHPERHDHFGTSVPFVYLGDYTKAVMEMQQPVQAETVILLSPVEPNPTANRSKMLCCTRCMDPYSVNASKISPIRVLWNDRTLSLLVGLMTICTAILLGASYLVWSFVHEHFLQTGERLRIRVLFFAEPVDAFHWVYAMAGFFGSLYAVTLLIVFRHCSGYVNLSVNDKERAE